MKKLRLALSSASTTVKVLGLVMLFTTAYASVNFYQKHSFQPEAPSSAMMMSTAVVGVPCYANGAAASASGEEGFLTVDYAPEGANPLSDISGDVGALANANEIGSTWGSTYNPLTGDYYAATVLKRHSGYASNNSGVIYRIAGDPMATSVSPLINLDGMTAPVFDGTMKTIDTGDGSDHGALGGPTTPNQDTPAFALAGKSALGDLDITSNYQMLYVINAKQSDLIQIDISNPAAPSVANVYPINSASLGVTASNGELRPWGLEIAANGDVYVGVVATGENLAGLPSRRSDANFTQMNPTAGTGDFSPANIAASRMNLKGYVYKLNPSSPTLAGLYTQSLTFDLDYARGNPGLAFPGWSAEWNPWSDFFDNSGFMPDVSNGFFMSFPQPLVADIDIMDNGDLLVSVMDRYGLQTSAQMNHRPGSAAANENGRPAGDVLRFPSSGAGWSSIPSDKYGDVSSAPEDEATLGGIAYGSGNEFIAVVVDAISANSNGIVVIGTEGTTAESLQTVDGTRVDNQDLITFVAGTSGALTAAKGLALGDLTLGVEGAPPCVIVATATPGTCDGGDGNYDLSLTLTYANDIGGVISITGTNGIDEDVVSTSSPQIVSIPDLAADGADVTINISFDDEPTCSNTVEYSAPPACGSLCSIDSVTPCLSECTGAVYDLDVVVAYSNVANGTVITAANNGTSGNFTSDGSGEQTITLSGINGDGSRNIDIVVTVAGDPFCTSVVSFSEPNCGSAEENCVSQEFVYVNDIFQDLTHKFALNPGETGATYMDEVFGAGGAPNPWVAANVLDDPHGVSIDPNGFIYISELDGMGGYAKLDCDGNIIDILAENISATNHVIVGDYAYSTSGSFVNVHNLCDGLTTSVGFVQLGNTNGNFLNAWGITYNPNDKMLYVSDNYVEQEAGEGDIYSIDPSDPENSASIWQTNATINSIITGLDMPMGITFDNLNNMYFTDNGQIILNTPGIDEPSAVRKYTLMGGVWTQVASVEDNVGDMVGFNNPWGIVWSESSNKLLVTSFQEDCIAVIDATTMTYENPASVPHVPGGTAKAIGIINEGCYTGPKEINVSICADASEEIRLRDLIGCDVCAGMWTPDATAAGIGTYDACQQSYTPTATMGSTFFTFSGQNTLCGSYSVKVNIDIQDIEVTPVVTCNGMTADVSLTVTNGIEPYTFDWSDDAYDGEQNPTGLAIGNYTVTVTDATGVCSTIETVEVTCATGPCSIITEGIIISGASGGVFDVTTDLTWTNGPTTGEFEYQLNDMGPWLTALRVNMDANGSEQLTITAITAQTTKKIAIRFQDETDCFVESVFVFDVIDPAGFIYCEETGEIISGGTISVSGPGNAQFLTDASGLLDGSNGRYAWVIIGSPAVNGIYTQSYSPPAGFVLSSSRTPGNPPFGDGDLVIDPTAGTLDNPSGDDPLFVGSGANAGSTALVDFSAAANPFVMTFDLASGDPFIDYNNIPLVCPAEPCVAGNLGGTAFIDSDIDGTNAPGEGGAPGVKVYVYECDGSTPVDSTTTDASGLWTIEGLSNYPYRVEFATPVGSDFAVTTVGLDNGTETQFIEAASCMVNVGLIDRYASCASDDRNIYATCFVIGNNIAGPFSGETAALGFTYDSQGDDVATNNALMKFKATASQVGTTYGVAHHNPSGKILLSSYLKRGAGFGPNQAGNGTTTGGIYLVDPDEASSNAAVSVFADLPALGINTGTDPHPTTTTNDNLWEHDLGAHDSVSKLSLGDIEFSPDFTSVFTVNLLDRSLIKIDVGNLDNPITSGDIVSYDLSANFMDCSSSPDDWRPFGLGVNRSNGLMYLGVVCTAESTQNRSELDALLYEFDPADPQASISLVATFDLDYDRSGSRLRNCSASPAIGGQTDFFCDAAWQPWSSNLDNNSPRNPLQPNGASEITYYVRSNGGKNEIIHPMPIFSDIEFTNDNKLIIGLRDRSPDIYGDGLLSHFSLTDGQEYEAVSGGDLLIADINQGNYTLENNASVGSMVAAHPANAGEGPGGNEFFDDNNDTDQGPNDPFAINDHVHAETSFGGIAYDQVTNYIAVASMNPASSTSSGGVATYNVANGNQVNGFRFYGRDENFDFGKASGVGDIEITCDPAPIEIGNYAWIDIDEDGVQDACEDPLPGLTVKLYIKAAPTDTLLVATTTTDANGNYYFRNSTDGGWEAGFDEIIADTTYLVVFCGASPNQDGTTTVSGVEYNITTAKTGEGSEPDNNDSDADLIAIDGNMVPAFCFITDIPKTNYGIDAGFTPEPVSIGDTVFVDLNYNGLQDAADSTLTGVSVSLYDAITGNQITEDKDGNTFGIGGILMTNGDGYYKFENLPAGSYYVEFDASTNVSGLPLQATLENVNGGSLDARDSDVDEFGRSDTTTLVLGEMDCTLDAGYIIPGKIGDTVFVDANFNGIQDAGDMPAVGVKVTLLDAADMPVTVGASGAINSMTMTDATGMYMFGDLLPGMYKVKFDISMLPGQNVYTLEGQGTEETDSDVDPMNVMMGMGETPLINIISGDTVNNVDAGIVECLLTVDLVPSMDECIDPINGNTITAMPAGGSGNYTYLWSNGETSVSISPTPTGTTNYSVTVTDELGCTAEESVMLVTCSSIGNKVFYDANMDGQQGIDEPGVPGVEVFLLDKDMNNVEDPTTTMGSGVPWSVTTDANGMYIFDNIFIDSDDGVDTFFILFDIDATMGETFTMIQSPAVNGNNVMDTDTDSDVFIATMKSDTILLMQNQSFPNIDAGIIGTDTLGNFVFEDVNGNGVQDNNEPGIVGDSVFLKVNGAVVDTTVTDANGKYEFAGLLANPALEYSVQFEQPLGFVPTALDEGGDDALDSDADPAMMLMTEVVTFDMPAQYDSTLDAGFFAPVSIGDTVFVDANGNGIQDPMEAPIENVTVRLFSVDDMGNATAVTTDLDGNPLPSVTDAAGRYKFENLAPGDYFVNFDVSTAAGGSNLVATVENANGGNGDPADSDINAAGDSDTVSVTSGQMDCTLDAGYFLPASVGDTAFVDSNFNGLQDPMEPGLPGVTVSLFDTSGTQITTDLDGMALPTMTGLDGSFKFENIAPNQYYVVFDVSTSSDPMAAAFVPTTENVNGGTLDPEDSDIDLNGISDTTEVVSGGMDCTLDAGYFAPVAVGDTVFVDSNGNGLQDTGEPGIPGVTVTVFDNSGMQITQLFDGTPIGDIVTDMNGLYKVDSLLPGSYYVEFDVSTTTDGNAADYTPTLQNVNDITLSNNDSDIDENEVSDTTLFIESGEMDCTLDAGYFVPVSIGDTAFVDANANGILDNDEDVLALVGVELIKIEGGVPTVITEDYDGNLLQEETDADGRYKFENLPPGEYQVRFTAPTGSEYVITLPNQGVNDTDDSDAIIDDSMIRTMGTTSTTTLTSGQMNCTLDAGFYEPVSLGDTVFVDLNGNGIQDGEPGIPNVPVQLFDTSGTQITVDIFGNDLPTATDGNGRYKFENLAPNEYYVVFDIENTAGLTDAADYVPTIQNAMMNSNDILDSDINGSQVSDTLALATDSIDCAIDAGYFIPVAIGDTVFVDNNGNGLQDDDPLESGVPNVGVTLFRVNDLGVGEEQMLDYLGNDISMVITDATGLYKFENLLPGQYYVEFDLDNAGNGTDYYTTIENINGGTNDANDSDVDAGIQTGLVSDTSAALISGEMDCTLDAGVFEPISIGDTVFVDANINGIQDPGEPGLAGVTATLFYEDPITGTWVEVTEDLDGDAIVPLVSDATGRYKFENLPPGNYHVNFDSGGIPITLQDIGMDDAIDSDIDAAGNSDTLVVLSTDGMNCTFDAGYQGLDYGDLPDEYVTADSTNMGDAPKHVMKEGKFLGALVDQDIDGGPTADGSADDNTGSAYVVPAGADGDDEDGIEFISPMLPGELAYVKITYTATNDAFLNAWTDFDGSGTFTEDDTLSWVEIDGAAITATSNLPLATGTSQMIIAAFEVPETATYRDGNAYSRFRMSCTGDLEPSTGLALDGEIEDYVTPLGKIGNLVWLDENFDGLQDPAAAEQVVPGVQIVLTYDTIVNGQQISIADTNATDAAGLYNFCGLTSSNGKYQLTLITPDGYASSMMNVGNDEGVDNDADIIVGIEGRDSIQTDTFMVMDVTMLPQGEAGQADMPNVVNSFPDNQFDQTFDFGLVVLDFGDLPEDFGDLPINFATDEDGNVDPPKHIVATNKRLGMCVDSEPDGQPDPMGMGDDDNMASSSDDQFQFGTCTPGASDEDGIEFLTPLIPGDTAFIKMTYTLPPADNPMDQAGYLNAWIDFDGNGILLNAASVAGEDDRIQLFETTGFAAGIARPNFPLDAGTDSMMILGFRVPDFATFNGGQVFSRFRLSCEGGLLPVGILQDGSIPEGEVEDYVVPLTKVGNLVWLDQNYDGIQDTSATSVEEGIAGVEVNLTYNYVDADRNIDLTISVDTITDENGKYDFCGLFPTDVGEYKITVNSPEFMTPTVANNPTISDSLDSDHAMNMGDSILMTDVFMIPSSSGLPLGEDGIEDDPNVQGTFRDSLFDQTFDFGFVPLDYGDLDSSYVTAAEDGGPVHIISEDKFLGQGADAERTAAVDSIAGALADGDDNAPGLSVPDDATISDDEDGIVFLTPLIPGTKARVSVSYTLSEEDGFLNGWIDFNGNGMLDAAEALEFYTETAIPNTDGALTSAVDTTVELCFNVPADALYRDGDAHARFRLSCEGGLTPEGGFPMPVPNGPQAPQGEVEDYLIPLAKIGNLAFFDNNLNGAQDSFSVAITEAGVPDVNHILVFAGPDGVFDPSDFIYNFTTDANGNYFVCGLIEGEYNVVPTKYDTSAMTPQDTIPQRYILTAADCADDNLDSDFMPNLRFAVPDLLTTSLAVLEDGDTDNPGGQGFPDVRDQINYDQGWIPEPNIEAIANIAGVDFPESGQCGNFNVIADVCLQNTGYVEMDGELIGARLDSIDIEINLGEQFMGAFVGVIGEPIILDTVEYEDAFMLTDDDDRPNMNPDFDGLGDVDGSLEDGILEPSEIVCLRIEFEIRPEELSDEDAMNLAFNAVVSAGAINDDGKELPDFFSDGAQYMAVDSSDRLFAFDGTFGDPDEPEPLGDCYETSLPLSQQPINLSFDENCMALITPQMVLTELDTACLNEAFPLGGYYRLQLEDLNGNVIIPFTDSLKLDDPAFVGNMYNVRASSVADVCNSSWGKITVENKFPPVIQCMSDTITCGDLIVMDPPSVDNNCGEIELSLVNRETMDVSCEDAVLQTVIVETWEVRSADGVRMSSCEQTLSIEQLNISDVVGPVTRDTTLSCTVGEMPSPEVLGVPTLNGVALFPDNFADCNIFASFVDEFFDFGNDCTNGVQRTWTVSNWVCGTDNDTTFTQLITLVDTTGPILIGVPEDMTVSTSGQECDATVIVPAISAIDDCNNNDIRVDISYEGGFTMNQNGDTIRLAAGTSEVRYIAYDVCGNATTASFSVTVQDLEQPVTICDAFTTVSLNTEGKASLSAVALDNGSMDECGPVTLEIMRMDDTLPFREEVDFTCADIGPDNIMVILRVTDVSGNTNQCMAEVTLQDKLAPVLVEGLPDITVSCDYDFSMDDLSVFGSVANFIDSVQPIVIDDPAVQFSGPARDALILDNCATAEMSEITGGDLDQCGNGTLIRTITATSPNGETLNIVQNITLVNPTPFVESDITWPLDVTITSEDTTANPYNLPMGTDFPQFTNGNCDMVSATFEDDVDKFNTDECTTVIRRTWFVSDWCQRVNGVFVIFENTQLITINREDTPTILSACGDITIAADPTDCTGAFVPLVVEAEAECSVSGLVYTYDLDFNNNGSVDASGASADASGFYPPGTHRVTFTVVNGESSAVCSYLFTVTIIDPTIVIMSVCEDVTVEPTDCDGAEVTLLVVAEAGCATDDLTYSYTIDLGNDGSIDLMGTGADATDTYPPGEHRITFTIDNGMDTEVCTYLFTVNMVDIAIEITSTCDDVTVNADPTDCSGAPVSLLVEAQAGCATDDLSYSYGIDIDNDGSIDETGSTADASGNYPPGTHQVTFTISNGVDSEECAYLFTVNTTDTTEAICQPTQTVVLELTDSDDDGMNDTEKIVIAPSLIDNGSNNSCSRDITLSFTSDVTDQMRMYGCDDVGQQALMLWVTDANGNQASCITSIVISDDNGEDLCTDPGCCEANDYSGMAVVTCNVDFDSGDSRFDKVGKIYDTRLISSATPGTDWSQTAPIAAEIPTPNWTYDEIGPIFGIAVDDQATIFLAQSDVYNTTAVDIGNNDASYEAGWIYRALPPSFTALPFTRLPNTGGPLNGIGNVVYDNELDLLYATNLEDGKIYMISSSGLVIDTYDPFAADDDAAGIVVQDEQIWGIGLNVEDGVTKLYFPRITASERSIYSIIIDDGVFPAAGSETAEITGIDGIVPRITDIAFSMDNEKMLFTERGLDILDFIGTAHAPHVSKTLNYELVDGTWELQLKENGDQKYYVGGNWVNDGQNSAGGVSFGYGDRDGNPTAVCDTLVWVSGNAINAIRTNDVTRRIYGIQGIDYEGNLSGTVSGGNLETDLYVDFNGVLGDNLSKGIIGDVEIISCGTNPPFLNDFVDISGTLYTEEDTEISGVQVTLEGADAVDYSDESGAYLLPDMPMGGDYVVKPIKNSEHRNGVTTLDLLHIQRHILGVTDLDSPYKLIAADINRDGKVTGSDLLQLRKLILGIYEEFPNNTSWRFIDADHEFVDAKNPWAQEIPESYEIYSLASNMVVDFSGLKVGDVNGTAQVNGVPQNIVTRSSAEPFILSFDDRLVKAGETVLVPFYGDSINNISGFQFTINVDPRSADIYETVAMAGSFSDANFGDRFSAKGYLTSSWDNANNVKLEGEKPLFSVKLIAKRDMKLSDVIRLTSDITTTESYTKEGELLAVELGLRSEVNDAPDSPELFQNEPNPWIRNTVISFRLPEAVNAQLRIFNATGKLVKEHSEYYEAGVHEYEMLEVEFAARGVYYYELITDGYKLSKKMVLIK